VIHQHIFATPKPGMTPEAFQEYWLHTHAPKFASKIPQIRKYRIDRRLPFAPDPAPVWHGVAEIWLANEEEQIASLQSPEFLEGARADEPNWAAFWATLGLDCTTETLGEPEDLPEGAVKLLVLYKRARGLTRDAWRDLHRLRVATPAAWAPGVLRHDLAVARDALYAVGEPRFDGIGHYWFADMAAAEAFAASPHWATILPDDGEVIDPAQRFFMLTREDWVIGPAPRA
jgi:uncharacterized protein (TIGR02118 family)